MPQFGTGIETFDYTGQTGGGFDSRQAKADAQNPAPPGVTVMTANELNDLTLWAIFLQTLFGGAPLGTFASLQARLDSVLPTSPGGSPKFVFPSNTVTFVDADATKITIDVGGVTRYIHFEAAPP